MRMFASTVLDENPNQRNEGDRDCDRSTTPAPGDHQGKDLGQGQSEPESGGPGIWCFRDRLFHQEPNAGRKQGQSRSRDLNRASEKRGIQTYRNLGQADGHGRYPRRSDQDPHTLTG